MRLWIVAIALFGCLAAPAYPRIDLRRTWFGIECTFQDRTMLADRHTLDPRPGYEEFIIGITPHKQEMARRWAHAYLHQLGLPTAYAWIIPQEEHFQEGYWIVDETGFLARMSLQPLVLELSPRPARYDQIETVLDPIYASAAEVGLSPYLSPGGRDSGGGEIHVGGPTLGDSPLWRYPHLLRNLMVYVHRHPSLLYGFGEVFEYGPGSSMETYHPPAEEEKFRRVVAELDRSGAWRERDGVRRFVMALDAEKLVNHDRYINTEHLKNFFLKAASERLTLDAIEKETGKLTAEFRTFRAAPTPKGAKARAYLLTQLMERLSEPGYLVPFDPTTPHDYALSLTASAIDADWAEVKRELGVTSPLLDAEVAETVGVCRGERRGLRSGTFRADVFPAFSPQEPGRRFELRVAAGPTGGAPEVTFDGRGVAFRRVRLGSRYHWIASLDAGPGPTAMPQIEERLRVGGTRIPPATCGSLVTDP